MSLNQEERTAVVTYRLEKAERALMQAKARHNCTYVRTVFR